MSRTEDYVSSFQNELQASAELVQQCADLEAALEDTVPPSKASSVRDFSRAMDATVLALNKGFLRSLDAQDHVAIVAKEADQARQLSQSLSDEASAARDFDEIRSVYADRQDNASAQSTNASRSNSSRSSRSARASSSQKKADTHQYTTFAKRLLRSRNRRDAPSELFSELYKDYVREQGGDDGDVAVVGESISNPQCLISLQPLEEPVRAPCGHYFSKDVILSTLQSEGSVPLKCPSPGCSHDIKARELVRDPFKDLEVNIWLSEQERKRLADTQAMTAV